MTAFDRALRMKVVSGSSIPFHRPSIGEQELAEVTDALTSGWLTSGPKAREFEELLLEHTGARAILTVSSGTAALHLALDAAGVNPGSSVVVPVMTFTATAEAPLYLGARLHFTDVDADTLCMSAAALEQVIPSTAAAVVPVDLGGLPHPHAELRAIARQHAAVLIADSAHSLGSQRDGRPVGADEDFAAFSFYATKPITTGEGGALAVNDMRFFEKAKRLRLHGLSDGAADRYTPQGNWDYEVIDRGYKYNMPDVNAAIGVAQLRRIHELQERRAAIARTYLTGLIVPQLTLPHVPAGVDHNWHLFVVRLNLATLKIDRNRFIEELRRLGIHCSVHFKPLHLHPFYQQNFGLRRADFPIASAEAERIVSLPIYPSMTDEDAWRVVDAVTRVCRIFRR